MNIVKIARRNRAWVVALGLLALGSSRAGASAINYNSTTDQSMNSYDSGGVMVTGSGPLTVGDGGINVAGGVLGTGGVGTTDSTESLTFKFDAGPASGIVLGSLGMGELNQPPAVVGEILVTAFDASGQALGTMTLLPTLTAGSFNYAISTAFGDVPISSFLLRPFGDATAYTFIQPNSLNFSSSTVVPEPSTLAIFATAAAIPALRRLARRRGR